MQKREEKFFEKIVKKDYNDKLEKILEKKAFAEDAKSILLNILYKIEASYKDYKQVKQNVETKEEIIEGIIETIQNECQKIKLINPNSEESSLIGNGGAVDTLKKTGQDITIDKPNNIKILKYSGELKTKYIE